MEKGLCCEVAQVSLVKQCWLTFVQDAGTPLETVIKSSRLCSLHFDGGRQGCESVPTLFEPGKLQFEVICSLKHYTSICIFHTELAFKT